MDSVDCHSWMFLAAQVVVISQQNRKKNITLNFFIFFGNPITTNELIYNDICWSIALHVNCYSKSQRLESDLVLKIVEIIFFFRQKVCTILQNKIILQK